MDTNDCYDKSQCIENNPERKNDLYFCCCDGDMCNKNFSSNVYPSTTSKPTQPPVIKGILFNHMLSNI